jgi:hypothetical protein
MKNDVPLNGAKFMHKRSLPCCAHDITTEADQRQVPIVLEYTGRCSIGRPMSQATVRLNYPLKFINVQSVLLWQRSLASYACHEDDRCALHNINSQEDRPVRPAIEQNARGKI